MIYAYATVILLYYSLFLAYYQKLFPASSIRLSVICSFLTLILVLGIYWILNYYQLSVLNMPVVTFIMIISLNFSTGMNWLQSVYGGSICVMSAYCFRGIFTPLIVFLFEERGILTKSNVYYVGTFFALPIAFIVWSVLRYTILPDHKLIRFMYNRDQLKSVVAYETVAFINMMVLNVGRKIGIYSKWYMGITLGTSVLTLGMLIYVIYESIKSTELMEYKYKSQMLQEQFDRQLRHYKSYQKYTESFREFKHDYQFMMTSLKTLIRAKEDEKAMQLIDEIYDNMQTKVHVHKKYSNHVVLDAMLQDLANICAENKIRFTFHALAPRNTELSLLDAIRIFSNITNNAIEACQQIDFSDRFIEINSSTTEQWIVLEVINSCNGKISMKKGRYMTTKKEKESHGMGLRIVSEIVESIGGFILYNVNQNEKTFQIRVHIPTKVGTSKSFEDSKYIY
jgi:two-component system sensor histidine kinase AgrC